MFFFSWECQVIYLSSLLPIQIFDENLSRKEETLLESQLSHWLQTAEILSEFCIHNYYKVAL